MDQGRFSISAQALHDRLGAAAAPLVIDVRRAAAFDAVLGSPGEKPVALIGAGGVGRAIAFALAELGARALHIFDSDTAKANALAARLEARMVVRVCHNVAQALDGAGGVINGTPIGMLPRKNESSPNWTILSATAWVMLVAAICNVPPRLRRTVSAPLVPEATASMICWRPLLAVTVATEL